MRLTAVPDARLPSVRPSPPAATRTPKPMLPLSNATFASTTSPTLIAAQGPDLAYWLNAVTFVLSATFLVRIPAARLQAGTVESRGHDLLPVQIGRASCRERV